ncbi:VCBS repeat-containing protein [Tellurirhabdus bombi]|uniref:VCBS repeat-containing protein n=1 Tax=Tellurirhabdus bombi TaxID=2907205 RepID=UPI001F4494F6|nr:VCBS repeat-containing protein [Tellurirhabdus bombi]
MRYFPFLLLLLVSAGCQYLRSGSDEQLFEKLSADETHLNFTNQVTDDKDFNIFNYRNFYNGGGVAIGDINQDGLSDVFLIANMGENKLYLNKGNLQFEDVTDKAGVAGKRAWSTGATFADINGDGRLDLYVCNSGIRPGDDRANELYINTGNDANGNPIFTEKGQVAGLDDRGFSTHAAFFDYDRDGDLDMYLLNNSFAPVGRLGYANLRAQRDSLGGHKLFRNDGASGPELRFTDVSEQAGIYGSLIGFGLGITIGDVNNDNWPDIYISNDFYERDYLYINNQNGSFTENIKESMNHLSLQSMGADIADINNDGLLDIFVTDMLPGNDQRLKQTGSFESYDLQQIKLSRDFHYQYIQNMLHLNNGNGTFSEIARFAGVHATDWSWGALIFDMDNDGQKDIFVANGVAKDITDQDFVNFLADRENMAQIARQGAFNFKDFLDKAPSQPVPNYAFRNDGNLTFTNKAAKWGLADPGFSNGAAYGDLDNDGDFELIVNNVNAPVSVYKNLAQEKKKSHYLKIKLVGEGKNRNAIGAKVYVYQPGRTQLVQQMPNRGFQSSVDLDLLVGLGTEERIDSLTVIWPNDKKQTLLQPKIDQLTTLRQTDARQTWQPTLLKPEPIFEESTKLSGLTYTHQESHFVDYNRDPLLKQMLSTSGPAMATGDVNGDGLEDVFFGGASGHSSRVFVQQANGRFVDRTSPAIRQDTTSEAVDAELFDADGDGDLDLYVVTGSNEFEAEADALLDRFYLNDGKGNFTRDERLPSLKASGSCVAASDFDGDGDIDLFVGSRLIPGKYGYNPPSYLLINDGTGNFKNYTKRYLPEADQLGMITDAIWADLNGDRFPELLVAGDWMPIMVFENKRGKLSKNPDMTIVGKNGEAMQSNGWWNCLRAADIDGDGDTDLIAGNLGLNSRIKATQKIPAELYTSDFDQNGTTEQIINCADETGELFPMVLKADLQKEIPSIKKKYIKFSEYAGKKIDQLFDEKAIKEAVVQRAYTSESVILLNNGKGRLTYQALPQEVQFSPICGIEVTDINNDKKADLILAGNFFDVLPELGRYDANYGLVLLGKGKDASGKLAFETLKNNDSGFFVRGQVRRLKRLKQGQFLLAKNNDQAQVFTIRPTTSRTIASARK